MGEKRNVTIRGIRNPGVGQCLGFCTADLWSSLAYESAEQKPKHCLNPGFLIPLVTMPRCSIKRTLQEALLGQLRSDTPGDEGAGGEGGCAHAEEDPLIGGHGGVVDSQQSGARHEVHGHAEPVAHRGTVTLGDELAPEKRHGHENAHV